jgi:hypothetical protein
MDDIKKLIDAAEPYEVVEQQFSRITAITNIHFEQTGEQPRSVSNVFCQTLHQTESEPYTKRYKATTENEPLDLGWLAHEGISMVVIENLERHEKFSFLTDEEKAELEGRYLIINNVFKVPVGFSQPLFLIPDAVITVRGTFDGLRYRLTAFPK